MLHKRPVRHESKKQAHDWGIELVQRTPRLIVAQRAISDAKKRWYLRKSEAGASLAQDGLSDVNTNSRMQPGLPRKTVHGRNYGRHKYGSTDMSNGSKNMMLA